MSKEKSPSGDNHPRNKPAVRTVKPPAKPGTVRTTEVDKAIRRLATRKKGLTNSSDL